MKQAHFTLQGKGGVGKSLISALLVQYLKEQGRPVVAVDTDPVNATLTGYSDFATLRVELMENGTIIERNFDGLVEKIVEEDANFVIDNGAASFIPLAYYLVENNVLNLLTDHGKEPVIHTVITGSQALRDTLAGFVSLAKQTPPQIKIIVWLNEFQGAIEAEGKQFEEMAAYLEHKDRVHGIVRIPRQTSSTFGEDIRIMLERKMTFAQVEKDSDFKLMAKSRLSQVKKRIFDQLNTVMG